jgi:hypothetical protein
LDASPGGRPHGAQEGASSGEVQGGGPLGPPPPRAQGGVPPPRAQGGAPPPRAQGGAPPKSLFVGGAWPPGAQGGQRPPAGHRHGGTGRSGGGGESSGDEFGVLGFGFGQDENNSVSQVALRAILSIQVQNQWKMIKKFKKTGGGHYNGCDHGFVGILAKPNIQWAFDRNTLVSWTK